VSHSSIPDHVPSALLERQRRVAGLGWKPDLPDPRDKVLAAPKTTSAVPKKVDLRTTGFMPEVWDQGQIGSCTGHGVGALVAYLQAAQHGKKFMPSRLFIYYNERVIEGDVASDNGAFIRDGIKAVAKAGVAEETLWPYDTAKFAEAPPKAAYDAALGFQALAYKRVPKSQFKAVLAIGCPIVFGFTVFDSFETDEVGKTGKVPMPKPGEGNVGGHCVLMVGYDDATETFLCRNSWGPGWGQQGYFTLPYAFISHAGYASDFWTITQIESC
jgi:C1A family cysteine protease